ncbi:MAG: YciI family protein [Motilibacteraceae bacterium]
MSAESTSPAPELFSGTAFVLLVDYLFPLSRIDQLLDDHRAWLDGHFADGTFLVSGPRVPRVGGTILATGTSRDDLERRIASDPLVLAGAARYEVVEFSPTRGPYATVA